MTGRRLPLNWPGRIRKSFHKAATYTLLDAAALASTAPLDLSDPATAPDFVALSFYKIFGFPNIGALIVRKDSAHVLQSRRYFGGGTVDMVVAVNDTWHAKKDTSIHDRLEDGTLPFHSIFALDHAMNVHERLYGPNPMKFISMHTAQLGKQTYDGLVALKHSNGLPLCRIYKDDNAIYGDPTLQGATIALNVQHADGSLVGYEEVEQAADDRNIFVRSGSLCNPGGVATYLGWSPADMKAAFAAGHRCSNPTQIMMGKPTGVVRISLGAMSTSADVHTLLRFLDEVYVHKGNTMRTARAVSLAPIPPISPITLHRPGGQMHALNFAHTLFVPASQAKEHGLSIPSTAGSEKSSWEPPASWDPHVTALPQHPVSNFEADNVPAPPWNSAEYAKLRKPWEEDMRKQRQQYANVGMEIKVREMEEASNWSQNHPTPSVKARKFGRSVVNLLRTKSHFVDTRYEQP
ncbi:hypothetical protein LTR08_002081 [Meristemomyces frigidus]|nr:hypothetical protein LTR08_002081 [Meristemomyces frigidus]